MTAFSLTTVRKGAANPSSAAVFFHGYGSNGADLAELAPYLAHAAPDTAFFFPDAPEDVPNTPAFVNMRAWFDLPHFFEDVEAGRNPRDIFFELMPDALKAAELTADYVAQIAKACSLPMSKIVLAGFSQGGLLAILTGLLAKEQAAGIIGMSACCPVFCPPLFDRESVRSTPPAALIHGTADPVVPYPACELTRSFLKSAGCDVSFCAVNGMGHCIDGEAFAALAVSLEKFVSGA